MWDLRPTISRVLKIGGSHGLFVGIFGKHARIARVPCKDSERAALINPTLNFRI